MKKKIISILVGAAMAISIASAINANTTETTTQNTADALKSLGLFVGNEHGDYMLDNSLTREQGMVTVVRLLGKEAEAKENVDTYEMPFTDVTNPVYVPYIAYAYANGVTVGTNAENTTFTPGKTVNDHEYLTWVLRVLGYEDGEGAQFMWDNPYELAAEAGLISEAVKDEEFLRADVVDIIWNALEAELVVADEADDTTAADDTTVAEEETTVAEEETTVAEEETTVAEEETTVAEEETTVAEEETTVAEEETTVAEEETTVAEEETTVAEEETTVADEETTEAEDKAMTLADKLIEEGVFTAEQYEQAKLIQKEGKPEETTDTEADTTVAEDETTVADDETTVADDETTVADDETTVADEETTVADDETTEADDETTDEEDLGESDTLPHPGSENQLPIG